MKAYAIKDPKGKINISTVKEFKDECIDSYMDTMLIATSWLICKNQGYRCVPVEITEIKARSELNSK